MSKLPTRKGDDKYWEMSRENWVIVEIQIVLECWRHYGPFDKENNTIFGEHHPIIQRLAFVLGRTVKAVEVKFLEFQSLAEGNERYNIGKAVTEEWERKPKHGVEYVLGLKDHAPWLLR